MVDVVDDKLKLMEKSFLRTHKLFANYFLLQQINALKQSRVFVPLSFRYLVSEVFDAIHEKINPQLTSDILEVIEWMNYQSRK